MNAALQQRHSPQPSSGVAAGRVASNHIVNALHWEPGSRLDVILTPHTVVIRAVPLPEVATALAALTGKPHPSHREGQAPTPTFHRISRSSADDQSSREVSVTLTFSPLRAGPSTSFSLGRDRRSAWRPTRSGKGPAKPLRPEMPGMLERCALIGLWYRLMKTSGRSLPARTSPSQV